MTRGWRTPEPQLGQWIWRRKEEGSGRVVKGVA